MFLGIFPSAPSILVAPADVLAGSRAGGVSWAGRTMNRTMEANVVRNGQVEGDFQGPLG